ncbi:MAG TPA: hypothetical protein VFI68_00410 [Anaerolineales bacterium]|nr:hypothetical protein [Anaerolineales bacterium]
MKTRIFIGKCRPPYHPIVHHAQAHPRDQLSQGEEIMNEMPVTPEAPKKNNTPIIIAVVVFVLLCCTCLAAAGGWWFWNNGDNLVSVVQQII